MTEHSYRSKRPSIATLTKEEYRYIEPDSINEDLYCSICHDVFVNVKRTRRCKHLFCHFCIAQALSLNKSCPICRTPCQENELQISIKVQNDLDQLMVYCRYPECDWKGTRGALKIHLKTDCQFVPVRCDEHEDHPDCKEVLQRKNIEDHRKKCSYKMIRCPLWCNKKFYDMETLEVKKQHSEKECVNRQITCPQCNEIMLFHGLKEHDFNCLKKRIPCIHKNILGSYGGCNAEFERCQLEDHLNNCVYEPLKDAFHGINNHMTALERKMEIIQRAHKEELDRLSTLKLRSEDIKTPEQLRSILKFNPAIRSLHLLEFQPGSQWQYLTEVLQSNETIETINLKGSEIEKVGSVLLTKALKNNTTIHTLIIPDNNLCDQGVSYLSKSLETNKTIRCIELAGNNFGDKGMESFCRALEINMTLESLDLSWNNIHSRGLEFLSKLIERPSCSIHTLDISNNEIGHKGVEILGKALELNKSIITLNLEHIRIGSKGIEILSVSLTKNKYLEKLILAENNIDNKGVEVLSDALKINSSLHTLDLEGNIIGDSGAETLIKAMNRAALIAFTENKVGTTIFTKTIFLRRNQITREGIKKATKNVEFVRVVTERG
nr:8892_t:CDS:2 [Entrophospora candida]